MTTFTFTKGPGKVDWLDVVRPNGPNERIECPKQRIIPHDMVHLAVEAEIGARGFMTRVADGEAAQFSMAGTPESDAIERLVEVVQAAAWSGTSDVAEIIALYGITCDARGSVPLPLDPATVAAIQARMASLQRAWDAVPTGGTMTLNDPHAGLTG